MGDSADFQQQKLSLMTYAIERDLVREVWRLETLLDEALRCMNAYYTPLLHGCSTKEEAIQLLARVPDTVEKAFYLDYVHYGRDWSKPHLSRG